MKNLIRLFVFASLSVFFVLTSVSCKSTSEKCCDKASTTSEKCCAKVNSEDPSKSTSTADKAEAALLCGGCGQVKGTDVCCKADAKTCGHCGLQEGSPGCCKITKGEDVEICSGCGEVKGSEKCCDGVTEKCPKCNFHKKSPGCCIKK